MTIKEDRRSDLGLSGWLLWINSLPSISPIIIEINIHLIQFKLCFMNQAKKYITTIEQPYPFNTRFKCCYE